MKLFVLRGAALFLVLLSISFASSANAADVPQLSFEEAALRLKKGSYFVLIRHAQTVPGIGDPPEFKLDVCSTQRNLSDDGRLQSRQMGAALKRAGVRVDAIYSSAWCRCKDTAELAFEQAPTVLPLLNSFFGDSASGSVQTAKLKGWLVQQASQTSGANKTVWLVTHQVNITALTDYFPQMGEAVVLRMAPSTSAAGAGSASSSAAAQSQTFKPVFRFNAATGHTLP